MSDDMLRSAPDEGMGQSNSAMSRDDDQIGTSIFGRVANFIARMSKLNR